MLKPFFIALSLVTAGMAPAATAHAEKPPVYTEAFSSVAVGGYDAVSYFSGKPAKGDANYATEYKGATWRFASVENLKSFKANPAKYAPQYGGYCAWAAAQGYTAKGNPKNWRIVDGKLYLNYNDDVQKKWEIDIPGFISAANMNWPGLLSK